MKKIIGLAAIAIVLFSTACTDKTTEVTKEKVTIEKEAPKKTNVELNNNGVKVESKKVNVSVGTNNK